MKYQTELAAGVEATAALNKDVIEDIKDRLETISYSIKRGSITAAERLVENLLSDLN